MGAVIVPLESRTKPVKAHLTHIHAKSGDVSHRVDANGDGSLRRACTCARNIESGEGGRAVGNSTHETVPAGARVHSPIPE